MDVLEENEEVSKDSCFLESIETPSYLVLEDLSLDQHIQDTAMLKEDTSNSGEKCIQRDISTGPSDNSSSVSSNEFNTSSDESSEFSYEERAPKRTQRGRKAMPKKHSNRNTNLTEKNKAYLHQKPFDVYEEISTRFFNIINNIEEEIKNSTRGRPKKEVVINDKKLKGILKCWAIDLDDKIEKCSKSKRTDALDVTIKRKILKIPDVFLKYIASKSQYKSKDLKVSLLAYIDSFFKGFVPIFKYTLPKNYKKGCVEEKKLINDFFQYCVLSFPKDRVRKLLDMCKNSPYSSSNIESIFDQLEDI